jgi:chromosomal replication initiation ATPase DnaA
METGIAPRALELAIDHQRSELPDDGYVLDRLFAYLETTRPTVDEVRDAICEFYAVHPFEVSGRHLGHLDRRAHIVTARSVFCFLAYRYVRLSMPKIFPLAGYRDHTSVFFAIRKIENYVVTRPRWADDLDLLRLRLCEKILMRCCGRGS